MRCTDESEPGVCDAKMVTNLAAIRSHERIWNTYDMQGHTLALAWRPNDLKRFKLLPLRPEAVWLQDSFAFSKSADKRLQMPGSNKAYSGTSPIRERPAPQDPLRTLDIGLS